MTEQLSYTISPAIEPIYIRDLRPGRWQPRVAFDPVAMAELACSIRDHGQIEPILFWIPPDAGVPPVSEIVAGERRWRAICAIQLASEYDGHTLEDWASKCTIENPADMGFAALEDFAANATILARRVHADDPDDLYELALVDNIERANLSPVEEATALRNLQSARDLSVRDLAVRVGRSHSWVGDRLAILKLPADVIGALSVRADGLSVAHARHVGRLDAAYQLAFAEYLVGVGATRREAEDLAGLVIRVAMLPDATPAMITYRRSHGDRRWLSVPELVSGLRARWENDTRDLAEEYRGWRARRFPLDWNPRIVAELTPSDGRGQMSEDDRKFFPDPAACEFCPFANRTGGEHRCLNVRCFDRKNNLWDLQERRDVAERPVPAMTPIGEGAPDAAGVDEDENAPAEIEPRPAARLAEPARSLPVMTPIEAAPAARSVVVNIIISPGEQLETRPVLLTIGDEGTIGRMHKGIYADLPDLVAEACREHFEPELASIAIEPA